MAHFDINPHVIRQLGKELVSDSITALLELIKNSYDADASYVKVTINTDVNQHESYGNGGRIIVEDDGIGMDETIISKSWLVISYSNKRPDTQGYKKKTAKGRTPLGDKGLGRLSTQKLADVCEIYSKREGAAPVHVTFDWREFDRAETLSKVQVDFDAVDFDPLRKHGSKLILSNIVDAESWRGEQLERFKALLSQLISPYEKEEDRAFKVHLTINGESVNLIGEYQRIRDLSISNTEFTYRNAEVVVSTSVDIHKLIGNRYEAYSKYVLQDGGKRFLEYFFKQKKSANFRKEGRWLMYSQRFRLDDLRAISLFDGSAADPGDFEGKILEYSFNVNGNETWNDLYGNFKEYKAFVQNQVGIKIYRNGFAIRPYGITDKDWLSLGTSQTSGSSFYGLRPGNVIGYVAIDEGVNRNLKDKTDREGLIDNEYSRNFINICKEIVARVNEGFEVLRRAYNEYLSVVEQDNSKIRTLTDAYEVIETTGSTSNEIVVGYTNVVSSISSIRKRVEKVLSATTDNSLFSEKDPALVAAIQDIQELLTKSEEILKQAQKVLEKSQGLEGALAVIRPKIETLQEQLDTFAELASLGLISEMVSHDLGGITSRLLGKNRELEMILASNEDISREVLYSVVSLIKSTANSIRTQIKHLDSSMKYQREKSEIFSVADVIKNDEIEYYHAKFKQQNITPHVEVVEDFDIQMNRGKFTQIFDNIINNSIYWLQGISSPSITITIDKPWIYVEDNGHGIDPTVENTLFEPFVTRKPRNAGRGLGLFIIRQLLDTYGCEIMLDESRNKEGRLYKFALMFSPILK